MCICFSVRLTPSAIDASLNHLVFIQVFRDLINKYEPRDYALGYETLNKYGEPTAPHYHFNFICDAKKKTIQTFIRRMDNFVIKGNTMYSVSRHPEPDDYDRWFRYVAKERLLREFCKGFTEDELDKMELLAKDERKRSIKYNIEKRQFALEKQTLYDRYSKLIKSNNFRDIWIEFLQLYILDKKVINPNTIKGYSYLYMLQKKLITPEAFFEKNNK